MSTTGIATLTVTLAAAAGELIWPEPWVSRSMDRYRALPESERAAYARDVLQHRDRVRRERAYFDFGLSLVLPTAQAATIPHLENSSARWVMGMAAGTTLLVATVRWLATMLERLPSERLWPSFGSASATGVVRESRL